MDLTLCCFICTLITPFTYVVGEDINAEHNAQFSDGIIDNIGFDQVYVINLKRRSERRQHMVDLLGKANMNATFIEAVDGRNLTEAYLEDNGFKMMPYYVDPLLQRPMTLGEIGCLLSHHVVWRDVIRNNYKEVLVFEDDAIFGDNFKTDIKEMMAKAQHFEWDLIYLARLSLTKAVEEVVVRFNKYALVWPKYSYATISYVLSQRGAHKLVEQQPLSKMVPVDDYINIMFDQHAREDWKQHFAPRDLVALSIRPLLVTQTHYNGDPGLVSDTENSRELQVKRRQINEEL